jgi:hypothetical protein
LYKRDTALLSTTSVYSGFSKCFSDNSLNVNEKLLRVKAEFKDFNFCDTVSGTVKLITLRTLKGIEKIYFVPESFKEGIELIAFCYPNKPTIYIEKNTGLLYAINDGVSERKQAWHLLRILGKFGYVENYHRVQHRKQDYKNISGWKEQ